MVATRADAPGVPNIARTSPSPASARARTGLCTSNNGINASAIRVGTTACCTNSCDTSRRATTLTSPICGIFTTRRAMAYVIILVR